MDRPDGWGPGGRPFRERFTHAGGVSIGASGDLYTPGRHDRAHPSLRGGDPRAAWRCRVLPSACAVNVIIARARPRAGERRRDRDDAPARPWFGPVRGNPRRAARCG